MTASFVTVTDAVGITDTVAVRRARHYTLTDTVGITDVQRAFRAAAFFNNTVGISDTLVGHTSPPRTVLDTVGISAVLSFNRAGIAVDTWRPILRPDHQLVLVCRTPLGDHDMVLTGMEFWTFLKDGTSEKIELTLNDTIATANSWTAVSHPEFGPSGTRLVVSAETTTDCQIFVLDASGYGR